MPSPHTPSTHTPLNSTPAPRASRAGLADRLTLLAVLMVVVLVSLPRLRSFGLHDNETDALQTLLGLGKAVQAAEMLEVRPALLDLAAADETLAATVRGARRLDASANSAELLSGDRFLLHGYVFQWQVSDGQSVLLAWPWNVGSTGRGVFAWTGTGMLYGHANRLGLWTGPGAAPTWPSTQGGAERAANWRRLEFPARR